MPSRRVIVDDADTTQIQYIGAGWFADTNGSQDKIGNFGPTYRHTSHSTKLNGSLSFSFQGTEFTVMGTNNVKNTSGVYDPTWDCFLDKIRIDSNPFRFPENNWQLCGKGGLKDGPHELTVNITTTGQTFWFDNIQYTPSPGLPLAHSVILQISNKDPGITYSSGWGALGKTAKMTQTFGSTANLNFTGTGLSWIGLIPTELPHNKSKGTYSIDGGPQHLFDLKGLPSGMKTTQYNQVFFSTPELSAGPHTLQVTYQGNSSQTPLSLDYLYISISTSLALTTTSNAESSTGTSTSTSTSISTGTSPLSDIHPSGAGHGLTAGAIVGGVVGGFIILGLALFVWYRRRNNHIWHIGTEAPVSPYIYNQPAIVGAQPNPPPQPSHKSSIPRSLRVNIPSRYLTHVV